MAMFQYVICLLYCIPAFVILFASPILPTGDGTSCGRYLLRTLLSLLWVAFSSTILALFLFGTVIDQQGYSVEKSLSTVLGMVEQSILDYECVGSRVWMFTVCFLLPNFLLLAKILTN